MGGHARLSLTAGPLLGAARGTRLQRHRGAVRGAAAVRAEAQAGLDAGDRPVGGGRPLLVGAARAVPDDRPRAGCGAAALGVEALAAVHLELLPGGERPLLVAAAVAVPQRHLGAVALRHVRDVEAAAGAGVAQLG